MRPNWVGIAVAVAACLALAAYLMPDRHPREVALVPPGARARGSCAAGGGRRGGNDVPRRSNWPNGPRRAVRAACERTAPEPAYFVALDDEPFESGVIMRVDVKPGNVQADIVFGPDGRAHAFRLVNAAQRNF